MGGIITEVREPRLAIEGDIHLSTKPSASSCLSDFQHLPNDVYCATSLTVVGGGSVKTEYGSY